MLGAGSGVHASIPVDSKEVDFFTSSVPDFDPTVEVETSLREPVLSSGAPASPEKQSDASRPQLDKGMTA